MIIWCTSVYSGAALSEQQTAEKSGNWSLEKVCAFVIPNV